MVKKLSKEGKKSIKIAQEKLRVLSHDKRALKSIREGPYFLRKNFFIRKK
jgi:hypothetical protein